MAITVALLLSATMIQFTNGLLEIHTQELQVRRAYVPKMRQMKKKKKATMSPAAEFKVPNGPMDEESLEAMIELKANKSTIVPMKKSTIVPRNKSTKIPIRSTNRPTEVIGPFRNARLVTKKVEVEFSPKKVPKKKKAKKKTTKKKQKAGAPITELQVRNGPVDEESLEAMIELKANKSTNVPRKKSAKIPKKVTNLSTEVMGSFGNVTSSSKKGGGRLRRRRTKRQDTSSK
jgi:hypothetical protein